MADDPEAFTETVSALDETREGRPQAQQFSLEVIQGPKTGQRWLSQGVRSAIGSHESNGFAIEDRTVSRFHCEIALQPSGAWLRDVGSRNGTFVDNVRTREAMLQDGSRIRLGETVLRFAWAEARLDVLVSEKTSFGALLGRSLPMRAAFYVLERAAASDATLLIEGETGTGKDVAAETVHGQGARKSGPFVVVDCGAIQPTLIESELFGHERGAFTGATAQHRGAFERAHGGTVFLDEIGELPVDLQPKLLRVLEQRTVQRVGGSERIAIDVRVMAATNRDLRAAINDGSFRSDLYYRLAVISVRMPPLRERQEDIPLLVGHLLESMDTDSETIRSLLSESFFGRLRRAPWTGNVRELRNYLEQCVIMQEPAPLPSNARAARREEELTANPSYDLARRRALNQFESEYVHWLLDQTKGDTTEAARVAGVTRRYVYQLLRRTKRDVGTTPK